MESFLMNNPGQPDDRKLCMGNAVHARSDSYKTIEVQQSKMYKTIDVLQSNIYGRRKSIKPVAQTSCARADTSAIDINMESHLMNNPGQPDDRKPHMGNAVCKRSDSYKNVDALQPNKCNIISSNPFADYEREDDVRENFSHIDRFREYNFKTVNMENVLTSVRREFTREYKERIYKVKYVEKCEDSNLFVCVLGSAYLQRVNKKRYLSYVSKYIESRNIATPKAYICKTRCDSVILYLVTKTNKFEGQIYALDSLWSGMQAISTKLAMAKQTAKNLANTEWTPVLLNVVSMILHLRDGYLSFSKLLGFLLQMYATTYNIRYLFPQSTSSDILAALGIIGLPTTLLNNIKNFTALTGKKLFDSDFVMVLFGKSIGIVRGILGFLASKEQAMIGTSLFLVFDSLLAYVGSSAVQYARIKTVTELYTSFLKSRDVLHQPLYREEVERIYKECSGDDEFASYVDNNSNRHFARLWQSFKDNTVKMAKTYGTSRRKEPISFVFEGAAGSGKTTLMNNLVDYLHTIKQKSVYVHTTPPAELGKDFYDDYLNQDVFVMDDVGQQGVSQWRTLINFVSTTAYPLDCARAENKNTVLFNSNLILLTTNRFKGLTGFTSTSGISEPDALFRRPHVITVERVSEGGVSYHNLTYSKFDYTPGNTKWENAFIHPWNGCNVPPIFSTRDIEEKHKQRAMLRWVTLIVDWIERATEKENSQYVVTKEELDSIDSYRLPFEQQTGFMDALKSGWKDPSSIFGEVFVEWTSHYSSKFTEMGKVLVSWCIDCLKQFIEKGKDAIYVLPEVVGSWVGPCFEDPELGGLAIFAILSAVVTFMYAISYFQGDLDDTEEGIAAFKKACDAAKDVKYLAQGGCPSDTTRLEAVKRHVRMVVCRDDRGEKYDSFSQGLVSGDTILLPSHAWPEVLQVDIYQTMEHYSNKCKEREDLRLQLIKRYMGCDLAVYKMVNLIARYPNCNNMFLESSIKNPLVYLVNSYTTIPIILGTTCIKNADEVRYSTYSHAPNTGYYTPLTAGGACGTLLFTEEAGIVGFHIAGGADIGFCVVPPRFVAEDLRKIMLYKEDTHYYMADEVKPGVSGVRLRYDKGYLTPKRAIGATSLKPTIFHVDSNSDVENLYNALVDDVTGLTSVEYTELRKKVPPVFDKAGTPSKQLQATAMKTLKGQGRVTQDELLYIKSCLRPMFVHYTDIEDDVCAFGNKDIVGINKESSNGFGCEVGKEAYFDFEKKVIKPSGIKLFSDFHATVRKNDFDALTSLTLENFKDELRVEEKAGDPRTFRIMPLPHIWWTKKICANLVSHFKSERGKTGMCVGYNPYVESDELANKLRKCVVTGDIDFSKWDGSIMASIMHAIGELFIEFYEGNNADILKYLLASMATSTFLATDALYATTHGLPSGSWLTLVMNCLINKSLTALTLYRYGPRDDDRAFSRVVDYVMGDDKIIGANASDGEWFNLLTINSVASSLGMVCTNGDKTPIMKKHQPFDKLTFVKRHFRFHPELKKYVGCLSVETLLGTIQYYDSTKDGDVAINGKMRAVQMEAFLHSKSLFYEFTRIFKKWLPQESIFDYDEVRDIFMDDTTSYVKVLDMLGKTSFHLM